MGRWKNNLLICFQYFETICQLSNVATPTMQARKCLITLKAGFGPNLVDKTLDVQRLLFNFLFLCVSKSYLMIQWYMISSWNRTMGKSIWLQLWLSLTLNNIEKSLDRSFIIMQEFPKSRGAAMPGGVTVAASLSAAAPFAKVTQEPQKFAFF